MHFVKVLKHLCKVPLGPDDGSSCYNGFTSYKKIYASAEGFEQARAWIAANCADAQRVIADDLAEAEDGLSAENESAIVALNELADVSSVPMLASGLEQDSAGNARCIVIGAQSPKPCGRDKTSIICAVTERAGALRELLLPV